MKVQEFFISRIVLQILPRKSPSRPNGWQAPVGNPKNPWIIQSRPATNCLGETGLPGVILVIPMNGVL